MTLNEQLGKYRILDELGKGGFATVYRAADTTLDREVALKVLDPLLMRDEKWVKHFRQEAKTVAALEHPYIVGIYEIGEVQDRLYIAMTLAKGGSLAQVLADQGRLPWSKTLAVLQLVCEALDYAHGQGVVHRDLKPANVLLDPGGPLLTDFGFARLLVDNSMSMSLSGGILGTPAYIAPEIWEYDHAEVPADVYALGCITYEMLVGEPLFGGKTTMQVMRAHDKGPQFADVWPGAVPKGFSTVLRKALAREPETRYPAAGSFWYALKDLEAQAEAGREAAERAAVAAQWRAEAEAAVEEGEWRAAKMAVGRCLAVTPDDAEAQTLQKEIERRIANAQSPSRPDPLAAFYDRLQVLIEQEHWNEARQQAKEILARDPEYRDVQALAQQVIELQGQGEHQKTEPKIQSSEPFSGLDHDSTKSRRIPVWVWGVGALFLIGCVATILVANGVVGFFWSSTPTPSPTDMSAQSSISSTPTHTVETYYSPLRDLPEPVEMKESAHGDWRFFPNQAYAVDMSWRDGLLWSATYGGLVVWDTNSGDYYRYTAFDGLADNSVTSISTGPAGAIWVGTWGGGISRFDGDSWQNFSEKDGLVDRWVHCVTVDESGNVWVGTNGHGVSVFDGSNWQSFAMELVSGDVRDIAIAPNGDIWVATYSGLSHFDGEEWEAYTESDGLMGNWLTGVEIDSNGEVWVTIDSGGVAHFDHSQWHNYPSAEHDLVDYIEDIEITQDNTIFVSSFFGGISKFDGESWETLTGFGSSIGMAPDGELWIGDIAGICHFEDSKCYATDEVGQGTIDAVSVDPDGSIWVGGSGLKVFDGQDWREYTYSDGMLTYGINDIDFSPDEEVWIASHEGVSRFDGDSWSNFYAEDGLAKDYAYSVGAGKDDQAWIGHTGEGISYFDGQNWHIYTETDGLPSGYIKDIVVDAEGQAWAVTNKGVVTMQGANWMEVAEISPIYENPYYISVTSDAKDGSIWFAGENGLAHYKGGQWGIHQVYDDLVPSALTVGPTGVWIAGFGEVIFYNGQSTISYDVSDGVSYYGIRDIAVGQDGSIWIGGVGGVVKFTPTK